MFGDDDALDPDIHLVVSPHRMNSSPLQLLILFAHYTSNYTQIKLR